MSYLIIYIVRTNCLVLILGSEIINDDKIRSLNLILLPLQMAFFAFDFIVCEIM